MDTIQIPGKLFLMGEYAVISGGKAVHAVLKPAFEYSLGGDALLEIHPDSPAGRYESQHNRKLKLSQTSLGMGPGFGTSTAELIAAVSLTTGKIPDLVPTLNWYQSEFPLASGADLAAQIDALHSSSSVFELSDRSVSRSLSPKHLNDILIFQSPSNEKILTHENLKAARPEIPLDIANQYVDRLIDCITADVTPDWKVLTEWASLLSTLGLESEFATQVRTQFLQVAGVYGVKGCGAGLNDVFMVAFDHHAENQIRLLAVAEKFHLKFLGNLQERLWQ